MINGYVGNKTKITIPTKIDGKKVTNITIPNGVTCIEDGAFWECSGLTSITISASVTSIQVDAFYQCTALKRVNYGGTEEQWNNIDGHTEIYGDIEVIYE